MVWRRFLRRFGAKHSSQIPLFKRGTKGQVRKKKNIFGRRNYCIVHYDEDSMELVFDIRVEKEKGVGTTVRYSTVRFHQTQLTNIVPAIQYPLRLQCGINSTAYWQCSPVIFPPRTCFSSR